MATNTQSLRDLFLEVTDNETITESQEEGPSRDPIGASEAAVGEEVSTFLQEDGLDDAVEGAEG